MSGYLFLLFTIVPALELYVLLKVGAQIGALNTIGLLIVTGIAGATLSKTQGLKVLYKIQEQLSRGVLPSQELLEGALILFGGVLLLTPGFITDCVGIFFLIPWTRKVLKMFLKKKMEAWVKKGAVVTSYNTKGPLKHYDDIDIT